jgi:glycosyltransferase involved in cell wall biosynthesis
MKILVVNNAVPFVWGGAEELALNLTKRLNEQRGIEAELLRIPFRWEPKERIPAEIIANRNLGLINVDRVIALKFPAYLIEHDSKTIWLLHQFRQAYDLLDQNQSYLARGVDDELIGAVAAADRRCFDGARRIFANSPVTRDRLWRYNQRRSEVLYPPLNDEELFLPGPYGDYLLAGGRVARGKRQHLLVEAARLAGPECRLVIAGPPEDDDYAEELRRLVEEHGLADRVTLQLRLHTRAEIAQLVNNARACVYIPFQEDSLGYVTMEAFAAARAVATTDDSGGLLEIVGHDRTGLVCEPTAQSLADAFDRLSNGTTLARELGAAARDLWISRKIEWPHTLERLLS